MAFQRYLWAPKWGFQGQVVAIYSFVFSKQFILSGLQYTHMVAIHKAGIHTIHFQESLKPRGYID